MHVSALSDPTPAAASMSNGLGPLIPVRTADVALGEVKP
jgi:hypothetical protein